KFLSLFEKEIGTVHWRRSVGYSVIAVVTWASTSYAYYHLLAAIGLSRKATFFVSMGLVLVVMFAGLAFEDRLLWKGYFDGRYKRYDVLAGGRRTAPPPLMMGVIGGLFIFFFWKP